MVIKSYFIISILIIIASHFFFTKTDWKSDRYNFFENKHLYSLSTFLALIVGMYYNSDYQLFCNPVTSVYYFVVPAFIYVVAMPFLLDLKKIKLLNSFLHGISFLVFSYILLFAGFPYLVMLFFLSFVGIPIYIFTNHLKEKKKSFFYNWLNFYSYVFLAPLYILILLFKNIKNTYWYVFSIPIIFCGIFAYYTSVRMVEIEQTILKNNYSSASLMKFQEDKLDNYLLELILGLHWKYHTKLVVVDGWRPPFHNPLVGIRRMIILNPPLLNQNYIWLKELYQEVYPNRDIRFDCKCAKNQVWMN